MNHYTNNQWQNFKNGELHGQTRIQMENHLLECDNCMALYLELIDESDLIQAKKHIPPDFSRKVLELVKPLGKQTPNRAVISKMKQARRRILAFYTAAAAITIFLTGTGAFSMLTDISLSVQSHDFTASIEEKLDIHSTNFDSIFDLYVKKGGE